MVVESSPPAHPSTNGSVSSRAFSPSFTSTSSLLGLDLVATARSVAFDSTAQSGVAAGMRSSVLSFAVSSDSPSPDHESRHDGATAIFGDDAAHIGSPRGHDFGNGGGENVCAAARGEAAAAASRSSFTAIGVGSTRSLQQAQPLFTPTTSKKPQDAPIDGMPAHLGSGKEVAHSSSLPSISQHFVAPSLPLQQLLGPNAVILTQQGSQHDFAFAVPLSALPGLLGRSCTPAQGGSWEWRPASSAASSTGARVAEDHVAAAVNEEARSESTGHSAMEVSPLQVPAEVAQWAALLQAPALPPRRRELRLAPPPKLVWRLDDAGS